MSVVKSVMKPVLAAPFAISGVLHIVRPEFFLKIMPPYFPWHLELVYLSGVIEVVLAVTFFIPPLSRWSAWGLIALLIAVFPANIYLYQHQQLLPGWSPLAHLLRLPMQGVFVALAYWYTRPDWPTER